MSKTHPLHWIVFLTAASLVLAPATSALAQGGSTGGTIGKQHKSISGGGAETAPRRRAAPKAQQAKRRAPAPAESRRARGGLALSGTWTWSANCERGQKNYRGTFTFQQSGTTLEITHGGTNIWDTGTVTNGRISGNRVSFTRKWGKYVDQVNLALSGSRGALRMTGVLPNTAHSGRCQLSFTKN